jgi:hypothetical protein
MTWVSLTYDSQMDNFRSALQSNQPLNTEAGSKNKAIIYKCATKAKTLALLLV